MFFTFKCNNLRFVFRNLAFLLIFMQIIVNCTPPCSTLLSILDCLVDIRRWMALNILNFNEDVDKNYVYSPTALQSFGSWCLETG